MTTQAAAVTRGLFQRLPWWWYGVVQKSGLPVWVLGAGIYAALWALVLVAALAAGDARRFLTDLNWVSFTALPAFTSITLGYAPGAFDRLWANLRPWLDHSDAEAQALKDRAIRHAMRFFWIGALVWGGMTIGYGLQDPTVNDWSRDYPNPHAFRPVVAILGPVAGYFVGGAVSLAAAGTLLFVHRLHREARINPSFVLNGGKSALQPFNRLVFVTWGTVTLPFMLFILGQMGGTSANNDALDMAMIIVLTGTIIVTIALPQLFMARLLASIKGEAVLALRRQVDEAGALPNGADSAEVLRRMHRHQHLTYQLHQAETFLPTLVDIRFVVQVGTAIGALIVGNGLIPIMFAQLV